MQKDTKKENKSKQEYLKMLEFRCDSLKDDLQKANLDLQKSNKKTKCLQEEIKALENELDAKKDDISRLTK